MYQVRINIVIAVALFLSSTFLINAQEKKDSSNTQQVLVVLINGTEYIGEIVSDDGRELLLNTITIGKVYLRKSDIKEIKIVQRKSELIEDVYIGNDLFSTRYFISTNGFPVKKKDSYVMLSIYGPEFQMAISNHFSIGIMTSWGFAPLAVTGKYSYSISKNLHLGAGFIGGTSTWIESFRFNGGLGFGSLTYGNRNYNVSLSGGYAHLFDLRPSKEEIYGDNGTGYYGVVGYRTIDRSGGAFLGSVSGTARIGKRVAFVMENFYYNDGFNEVFVLIPGFRTSSNTNSAFQFGVAGIYYQERSFPIPMLTWFLKIN